MNLFVERGDTRKHADHEVARTYTSFEAAIQDLYFPDQATTINPIRTLSNNVRLVIAPDRTFIAKCMTATPYNNVVLETERIWSDRINKLGAISAPTYIQSKNKIFFPRIKTDSEQFISMMTYVDHTPFELKDYKDYERLGIAIALLHKSASGINTDEIRRFEFSTTNPFVESYWSLLKPDELSLFKKILDVPASFDSLPIQLTHNDIHPENLMSSHQGTPLYIDFDQMLIGPRINDVGQALSAFWLEESMMGFEKAKDALIKGYNKISPLTPDEISALPLFALRKACISFTWFKGLSENGDSKALEWYRRILNRSHIIDTYIKMHGYYSSSRPTR